MTDFLQASPRYKPFKCGAYWHLRSSGLYLAIYDLIGAVTAGGTNPFFTSIKKIAQYFGSNYGSTHAAFTGLCELGWLERLDGRKFRYVDHATWAAGHPGQCNERDILQWQTEPDALLGQLFAIAGGKLRLHNGHMVGIRKFASDEKIIELYRKEIAAAEARKQRGEYKNTKPIKCFWTVYYYLKECQVQSSQQKQVESVR